MEATAAVSEILVMSWLEQFVIGGQHGHGAVKEMQGSDGEGNRTSALSCSAGLDQDHCRVDRPGRERQLHTLDKYLMVHVTMGQQHLDQGPGPGLVAQLSSGGGPESFVGIGERTRGPSGPEGRGPGQSTGLVVQHLEVVIEAQPFSPFAHSPFVTRHHPPLLTGFDVLGPQKDIDAPSNEAGRDRIEALAHTDPGLVVDPWVEGQHHLEGFGWQRTKGGQFVGELGADTVDVAEDVAAVVGDIGQGNQLVQLAQGLDLRQRDQVAPTEATNFSLHTSLFMGTSDAGEAEERVEAVVAAHGHEALGLLAIPALEHPDHGRLEVVIANASGHPTELLEGSDMAVDEDLLGLVGIDPVEGLPRGGQPHDEHAANDLLTGEPEADLAEVDFSFLTDRMRLRDVDLSQSHRAARLHFGHIAPHRRFAMSARCSSIRR
jgi:hypothetical protein